MAVLHADEGVVIVRLVFDGLPFSGKTTSVRSLGGSLTRPVTSPAEVEGRTLYFDWLEYTGGRFEGMEIRCQIVSVPGQPELRDRRLYLLRQADAIVFVADSRRSELPAALGEAERLIHWLAAETEETPIGIVLQANKRDAADAVPLPALREMVRRRLPNVGIVESCATANTGIREAFVFAVRLALDRVRELIGKGQLRKGPPDVNSPNALLREMNEQLPVAATAFAEVLASQAGPEPSLAGDSIGDSIGHLPNLPGENVPSGMIWPPIDGRIYLHEALAGAISVNRAESGDYLAADDTEWLVHSPSPAVFPDLEEGRRALIDWARVHAASMRFLSRERCIVLVPNPDGACRLWQIVRRVCSVRDRLQSNTAADTPDAAADLLLDCTRLLATAIDLFPSTGVPLDINLDTLGTHHGSPVYLGLMPYPALPYSSVSPTSPFDLLAHQFATAVKTLLKERSADIPKIIDRILACDSTQWGPGHLRESLAMAIREEQS